MKNIKHIIIAAFAVVIGSAYALPAISAHAVSSAALSITPKKTYTIEPGKEIKDTLTIRNLDSASSLKLTLRAVDFSYDDDGGTPKLMLDKDAPQTTWSLKPFLKLPESVEIPAGGSKSLDISLDIPEGQGAGSFYSAIVYSSGAADGGNVGLSASGVTLVFASVPGTVSEDLKLEKFGAYRKGTGTSEPSYLFMTTQEPDTMAYTLKNSGNVVESPVGSIKLKNMFGKEYIINNVNPTGSLALIGQSRTFTTCIQSASDTVNFEGTNTQASTCVSPGLWPGMYTASLELYYGQNGNPTQEIMKTVVFWYLPWWFIAVVAVVLAVAGFYVWKIVRAVRRSNARKAKKTKK